MKWNILSKCNSTKEILQKIIEHKNVDKEYILKFINNEFLPNDINLLKGIQEASDKILEHIQNGHKILIYGDYDVDGITSTFILYTGLKELTSNVYWKLPNRFVDGYGIHNGVIDYALENDFDVIITVDNGIAALDTVNYAIEKNIDIIITDHHQPKEQLPNTIFIDPHTDKDYIFPDICGAMVAFKLINKINNNISSHLLKEMCEVLTLAIIADVTPLINENRYYVINGLKELNNVSNLGLKTLLNILEIKNINEVDIGFSIAPCLNACGRLKIPDIGLQLLLSEDEFECTRLSNEIIKLNDTRKDLCKQAMDNTKIEDDGFIIKILDDSYGAGILGIIAGRFAEAYKRPCVILSKNGDMLGGSGRSVGDYNINNIILNNDFVSGGGHAQACGVKIKCTDFDKFVEVCNTDYNNWLINNNVTESLDIISEIDFKIIDRKLYNSIRRLAPFGNGNIEPIFCTKNVKIVQKKIVGKNCDTLQFTFEQNGDIIKSIRFHAGNDEIEKFNEGQECNIAYTISLNEFPKNVFNIQLILVNIE